MSKVCNHVSEEHLAFLQLSAERDPARVGDCPKCHASWVWVERRHHEATWAVPECDYWQCEQCDHQWGHS